MLRDIAKICHKYNIWLHLDGAFDGEVFVQHKTNQGNEKHRFSANAHKTLGAPLSTSSIEA